MREITNELQESKIEIQTEKEQRKEIKLIGQQRRVRGHILWEFNEKTRELQPATYKKEDVVITSLAPTPEALTKRSKVVIKENCHYFQALNRENALKKLGIRK
jgi:hypothetical protein